MVKGPWHRMRWNLGLDYGAKAGGDKQALGWAVVKLASPHIMAEGEGAYSDNEKRSISARVDALIVDADNARRLHGRDDFDGFELYVYGSDSSYRKWARAAAEGMTRGDHRIMVEDIARELRKRGQRVTIKKVF